MFSNEFFFNFQKSLKIFGPYYRYELIALFVNLVLLIAHTALNVAVLLDYNFPVSFVWNVLAESIPMVIYIGECIIFKNDNDEHMLIVIIQTVIVSLMDFSMRLLF